MKTKSDTKTVQNKHIRKGDNVVVISGNDRGVIGTVLRRDAQKAVVQGVNVRKKCMKASQTNPKGGIVSIERAIPLCKLKLVNSDGKAVKARVRVSAQGERELYYRDGKQDKALRTEKKSK